MAKRAMKEGAGTDKKGKGSGEAKAGCGGEKGKRGRKPKERVVSEFVVGLPSKGVSVVQVPLSEIDLEKDTFRFRVAMRVSDLVESIQREGQQFPVLLRGSKPPYQLISGFRRVAAIQKIGWDRVNAIIRNEKELTDVKAFKISFIENEMRKSLSDIDRANAVVKLKKEGNKSTEEVAELYALSPRQVQRLQSIVDFPKTLIKAMDSGEITTTHALILNSTYTKKPDMNLKTWIALIQEEKLSVEKLKKTLKKEIKTPKKKKRIFEKRGKGFRLYPCSYNPDNATEKDKKDIAVALKRALEVLRK